MMSLDFSPKSFFRISFWKLAVVLLLCLAGCASRLDQAKELAGKQGWEWRVLEAGYFDLASAQPAIPTGHTLWIYIEGDGLAYLQPGTPSSDPTPRDPVALRLALADPIDGRASYLARPCQYSMPEHGRGCDRNYWTRARYGPAVIASINSGIDQLLHESGAKRLVLVGYSGGGAVAVLAASERRDVVGIITVAANLDLASWTKQNGLSDLDGSLDARDFATAVADIPQLHLTGGADDVVEASITQAFVDRLPKTASVKIINVPGFTHYCCWTDAWPELLQQSEVSAFISGW